MAVMWAYILDDEAVAKAAALCVGYELEGEMTVIGECDPGFEEGIEKSKEKYQQWKMRMHCAR